MKKYFVIKLMYDDAFYNEDKGEFVGWLNTTRYDSDPSLAELDSLTIASRIKPCCVVEVFDN